MHASRGPTLKIFVDVIRKIPEVTPYDSYLATKLGNLYHMIKIYITRSIVSGEIQNITRMFAKLDRDS